MMLACLAAVLLALAPFLARSQNQECGEAWQRPCNGSECRGSSVFYKPANLCAECGGEAQFCCEVQGEWTCSDPYQCQILPNPYDNDDDGTPLGQTRLCVGDSDKQASTEPAESENEEVEEVLTISGQLESESCPAKWKQCAGLAFEGTQNCCKPGLECKSFSEWYSQCLEPEDPEDGCATAGKQCAGANYNGQQNCCPDGYDCVFENVNLSVCKEEVALSNPPGVSSTPTAVPTPTPSVPTPAAPTPTTPPSTTPSGVDPIPQETPQGRMVHRISGEMQWLDSRSPVVAAAAEWKYELDTMLGMSFFFYELQRAGPLPPSTRAPWRGDSLKKEGGGNLDGDRFRGGYFDAGDHNKFQLPTSFAVARLNWLLHSYTRGLKDTFFDGKWNYKWAREAAKWGADFMVKSVEDGRVLLHIGDIRNDHNYLGRAEYYPQMDRNIRWCNSGECSDVAGEIAAALAHAALAFQDRQQLSSRYWEKAKQAYAQTGIASKQFGNSNDAYELLRVYYPSTGVKSHVFFAAASMYAVCRTRSDCSTTEENAFKDQANDMADEVEADTGQKWFWEVPGWDNAWWDGALIMAQQGEDGPLIFNKPAYTHYLNEFVRKWVNGVHPIKITPMGQRFTIEWGSNRFAAAGAAIALMWADLPANMRSGAQTTPQQARCMALKQIHYVAGDNDRGSYIAGFGNNPPVRNHHRNSACAPWEQLEDLARPCEKYFADVVNPANNCPSAAPADSQGQCYPQANRPNRFKTHGALIGGPKTPSDAGSPDRIAYDTRGWNDWRTDWVASEQTLDYNAHYTMALAAAIELPVTFWTGTCGGNKDDLQLGTKAGLDRTTTKFDDADVYVFKDFQEFGFTRTLEDRWMSRIP